VLKLVTDAYVSKIFEVLPGSTIERDVTVGVVGRSLQKSKKFVPDSVKKKTE
jgi:hypothetical protein